MPVKISKILRDNGIRKLYHFTDRANLQSIIQHGGLYSWEDCAIKGIVIPRSGSNELSRSRDKQHGLQDYVRLSFTRNHPMMYAVMNEQRIVDPVILEIDVIVVDKPTTLFADRNATKNGANIGGGKVNFDKIHISTVIQSSPYNLSESEKEFYQAEVLVKNFIPLALILNIADFIYSIPNSITKDTIRANSGLVYKDYQNQLNHFIYDEVHDFSEGLAGIKKDGKWGFIDRTGKEVISCCFGDVRNFSHGLAASIYMWGWSFINKTGTKAIPFTYDYVSDFFQGLAKVRRNGKYGFINKSGAIVIPCTNDYFYVSDFSEGLALVKKDGKYGFIDKTGKEIIPCRYDYASDYIEGLAKVYINGKAGFIDKTGAEVISDICDSVTAEYYISDQVHDFSEGVAIIKRDVSWFEEGYDWEFIDTNGEPIARIDSRSDLGLDFEHIDYIRDFSEGVSAILLERNTMGSDDVVFRKWGYIDKRGKRIISCKYDDARDFSEGLAAIKLNERWGYIDKNGDQIISCVYDDARDFSEGFAAVAVYVNGILKWGFIDKNGMAIIPPNLSEQISDGDYPDDDLPF